MNVLPRYEVEKVDAVVTRTVYRYEKEKNEDGSYIKGPDGNVLQSRKEYKKEPKEGEVFDVYFPQGHSLRVVGEKELKVLNLSGEPTQVDLDSGEDVPEGFSSLKSRVQSKTRSRHQK